MPNAAMPLPSCIHICVRPLENEVLAESDPINQTISLLQPKPTPKPNPQQANPKPTPLGHYTSALEA